MSWIDEVLNEINPNPITAIEIQTQDGVVLRWTFEQPIQQSRIMIALGRLFSTVSETMPELSLPNKIIR